MTSLLFRNAALHLGASSAGAPVSRTGDLLVVNGRIAAMGDAASGSIDAPSGTVVHDLGGRSLLPGFQDAHVHPAVAGLALLGIDLSPVHSLDGYLDLIAAGARADASPVLTGVGWYSDVFPGASPTAAILDSVVPDRPVILTGHDGHSTWVNSAALAAAGITADTPDPSDGVVVRDASGAPSGVLLDGAMRLIASLSPAVDEDRLVAALRAAQARLHSVGITAWQDAMVGDSDLGPDPSGAYARLVASGELSGRVVQGLWWDRERGLEQIDELVERREAVRGLPGISANVVKVMQDGMVENLTAAMLSPVGAVVHRAVSAVRGDHRVGASGLRRALPCRGRPRRARVPGCRGCGAFFQRAHRVAASDRPPGRGVPRGCATFYRARGDRQRADALGPPR
jgi:predicted amidohydrolase YtcJ